MTIRTYENSIYDAHYDETQSSETDDPRQFSMPDQPECFFNNPIYATGVTENTYSIVTDASVDDGTGAIYGQPIVASTLWEYSG